MRYDIIIRKMKTLDVHVRPAIYHYLLHLNFLINDKLLIYSHIISTEEQIKTTFFVLKKKYFHQYKVIFLHAT